MKWEQRKPALACGVSAESARAAQMPTAAIMKRQRTNTRATKTLYAGHSPRSDEYSERLAQQVGAMRRGALTRLLCVTRKLRASNPYDIPPSGQHIRTSGRHNQAWEAGEDSIPASQRIPKLMAAFDRSCPALTVAPPPSSMLHFSMHRAHPSIVGASGGRPPPPARRRGRRRGAACCARIHNASWNRQTTRALPSVGASGGRPSPSARPPRDPDHHPAATSPKGATSMSAAAITPPPTTLPMRAFSLFCQGLRSPAIATTLGVPERTVRAWIAGVRQDIAADERTRLADEFVRALEHLHQLSAAAWDAFERDQQLPRPSYTNPTAEPTPTPPPASTTSTTGRHGPRYLRLALDAQRQIVRLLSLSDHPDLLAAPTSDPTSDLPADLTPDLTRTPPTPQTRFPAESAMPFASIPHLDSEIPAESAMPLASISRPDSEIPAESAKPSTAPSANAPLVPHGGARGRASDVPGAARAQRAAVGLGVRFPPARGKAGGNVSSGRAPRRMRHR